MIIILDSNLLLLFIVGTASRDYISKHKRLQAYRDVDFTLLTQMLAAAPKIVLTPNTLTEVSNLARQIGFSALLGHRYPGSWTKHERTRLAGIRDASDGCPSKVA